jgi:hypothetical protein
MQATSQRTTVAVSSTAECLEKQRSELARLKESEDAEREANLKRV